MRAGLLAVVSALPFSGKLSEFTCFYGRRGSYGSPSLPVTVIVIVN